MVIDTEPDHEYIRNAAGKTKKLDQQTHEPASIPDGRRADDYTNSEYISGPDEDRSGYSENHYGVND